MKKIILHLIFIAAFVPGFSQYKYLGNYTSDGTPLYFAGNDIISAETMNLVKSTLPEGYPVPVYNPQYISSGYDTDIILQDSADVWVTFVDEGAGYKNVLGFYTYDINNPLTVAPASSAITIIFPNVSKAGSGGSLVAGNKVKIGTFSANTGIGFILIADGWRSGAVSNGNWKLYSNPNFNPETNTSLRYHNVLISDSANNRVILGFEDIRRDNSSCDNDFNDALFYISANPYTAIKTSNFASVESAYQTVSSGNTGGLESNGRLADKIARRFFEREKNNAERLSKQAFQQKFLKVLSRPVDANGAAIPLSSYFPASGMFGNETAYVSTPEDLLKITNARDVFSSDYYKDKERVAAALATFTLEKVYDHTKNICDRLNGASLEDVRTIELKGFKLINTTFKKSNGETEYTITFSVKVLNNEYSLFSFWNIEQYPAGEYLNFQVWGNTMGQVCSITNEILQKLESEHPVINNSSQTKIPDVFIKKGAYKNGKLQLKVSNKKRLKSIQFDGNSRNTETQYLKNISQLISLTGATVQDVEVNTGFIFDIGLSITYQGNSQMDAMYLADGAWGADYDNQLVGEVSFSVTDNIASNNQAVFAIERNPVLKGKVKGTINLFRNAQTGNVPLDISSYQNISFDIQSNKPVEIVLVASNLNSWEERARYCIASSPQTRTITIPISKFTNNKGEAAIINAIKTLVFSINGDNRKLSDFNIKVSNVNFNKETIQRSILTNAANAFPNPFKRFTTLVFPSQLKSGTLQITDMAGRIVMAAEVMLYNGEYNLDAENFKKGVYCFTLHNNEGSKNSGKLVIQ